VIVHEQLRELEYQHRVMFGAQVVLQPVAGALHIRVGLGSRTIERFISIAEIERHTFPFFFLSVEIEKVTDELRRSFPTAWQRLMEAAPL
jgi:hypothetical protein